MDGDETDIDCGGSCPPCQKAKSSVNYNYNTSSLPQTTRAIRTITAGNADVHVLPGQDIAFISAGDIILKPGFHVHKGASFHGERKAMRKDVGADCGQFCEPARPNYICRDKEPYFYGWELANFTRCTVVIYQKCFTLWRSIYNEEKDINTDGHILLWDLRSGIKDNSFCKQDVFYYTVILTHCYGYQYKYEGSLTVKNCQKSLSSDLAEDNSVVSLDELNDNEWNIYPNPNSGSFTIGVNDISEIKQIQVFSPVGQMVYSVQNPDNNMINLPSTAKGTFFVKIITQTETVIKKIIIE